MRVFRSLFILLLISGLMACSTNKKAVVAAGPAYNSVEEAVDSEEEGLDAAVGNNISQADKALIDAINSKPIVVEVPVQNFFTAEKPEESTPVPQTVEGVKQRLQEQLSKAEARLDKESFQNSEVIYNYLDGIIYPVFTAKNRITDIVLEKKETLQTAPVVGDRNNWKIETVNVNGQAHIYLKPRNAGQTTNMIINTSKRVYRFNITSTAKEYMPAVSFGYDYEKLYEMNVPEEDLGKKKAEKRSKEYQRMADMAMTGQYQNVFWDYRFRYTANKRYMPAWMPTQAFDDGMRTYLFVPAIYKMSTRPVVMATDKRCKKFIVVNYRINGKYYIVDGVHDQLVLASGYDKKERVIISRNKKI